MTDEKLDRIMEIVRTTGKLSDIRSDQDFYDAGFSSINALQLLMELETAFDVTIADDEFVNARTCIALQALVSR